MIFSKESPPDYDYNNPFFTNSKYKFLYNEPNDYEELLDEASEIILSTNKLSTYEKIDNINTLNNKIYHKYLKIIIYVN